MAGHDGTLDLVYVIPYLMWLHHNVVLTCQVVSGDFTLGYGIIQYDVL